MKGYNIDTSDFVINTADNIRYHEGNYDQWWKCRLRKLYFFYAKFLDFKDYMEKKAFIWWFFKRNISFIINKINNNKNGGINLQYNSKIV